MNWVQRVSRAAFAETPNHCRIIRLGKSDNATFALGLSLLWELKDNRNMKNLQFWPESLGAMLEYWYIERGLLKQRNMEINATE